MTVQCQVLNRVFHNAFRKSYVIWGKTAIKNKRFRGRWEAVQKTNFYTVVAHFFSKQYLYKITRLGKRDGLLVLTLSHEDLYRYNHWWERKRHYSLYLYFWCPHCYPDKLYFFRCWSLTICMYLGYLQVKSMEEYII